jgi:hypothetical protein
MKYKRFVTLDTKYRKVLVVQFLEGIKMLLICRSSGIHVESLLFLTSIEQFTNSPVLIKTFANSITLVIVTMCPATFPEADVTQHSNLIQWGPSGWAVFNF